MTRATQAAAALALGVGVVFAGLWSFRGALFSRPRNEKAEWPSLGSVPQVLHTRLGAEFGRRKVYVDAGHGAEGNTGNVSCFCELEQDFSLRVGRHLAETLRATGHFEALVSREATAVSYAERVQQAEAWGAEVFVSIHSDVRGDSEPWSPRVGLVCRKSERAPGYAVLYSDEGPELAATRRRALATALSLNLQKSGFLAYDGVDYGSAYGAIGATPGVFVDRHASDKRIFVLRKPTMPVALIETHNALHPVEAERWEDPTTLEAFDSAVVAALVEFLSEPEQALEARGR